MTIRIGNAPTSWGVEKELDTDRPGWDAFLDEVRDCGYEGVELGPYGFLPTDSETLGRELQRRGLSLTAGYLMGPLHTESGRVELMSEAEQEMPLLGAAGALHLVIIPGIMPERAATAGRSDAAPRLDARQVAAELATIRAIAGLAASYGLTAGLHPHAGSYVEFPDEIDLLLTALEADPVGLVLDTGHCAFGGIDPVKEILTHGARIRYVHLKDVDPVVLARARRDRLGFWEAYRAGVFCPLGAGLNDFDAIRAALAEVAYDGWLTVEQDADPAAASSPRDDARRSLTFLQHIGLAP